MSAVIVLLAILVVTTIAQLSLMAHNTIRLRRESEEDLAQWELDRERDDQRHAEWKARVDDSDRRLAEFDRRIDQLRSRRSN